MSQLTSPEAVIAAIEECGQLGREAFLDKYGYGRSRQYSLRYEGQEYDVKAIVGVAFGKQFPERGPLANSDLTSGLRTTVPKLRELGFEVVERGGSSIGDALRAVMDSYHAADKWGGRELDDLVTVMEEAAPVASRDGLRALAGVFSNVSTVSFDARQLPEVRYDRLNMHFRRPVEFARLVLRSRSVDAQPGDVGGTSFLTTSSSRSMDRRRRTRAGVGGLSVHVTNPAPKSRLIRSEARPYSKVAIARSSSGR